MHIYLRCCEHMISVPYVYCSNHRANEFLILHSIVPAKPTQNQFWFCVYPRLQVVLFGSGRSVIMKLSNVTDTFLIKEKVPE